MWSNLITQSYKVLITTNVLTTSFPRYLRQIHERAYEVVKRPSNNYAVIYVEEKYDGHRSISHA